MSKQDVNQLIYKLVRESEENRLKAVSKILASVMIEKETMSFETKLTFNSGVSIIINSELKTNENTSDEN